MLMSADLHFNRLIATQKSVKTASFQLFCEYNEDMPCELYGKYCITDVRTFKQQLARLATSQNSVIPNSYLYLHKMLTDMHTSGIIPSIQ